MFDFEKLTVYQKTRSFNALIRSNRFPRIDDPVCFNQLSRASLSILLNLAEGTGRRTAADKRHFYVIARASVYECASIIDFLRLNKTEYTIYDEAYSILEEISKMLFAMSKKTENKG